MTDLSHKILVIRYFCETAPRILKTYDTIRLCPRGTVKDYCDALMS